MERCYQPNFRQILFSAPLNLQECETKIAQEIASLSKEDVSKEEMSENEEEVINLLLAQVRPPARTLPLLSLCFRRWLDTGTAF